MNPEFSGDNDNEDKPTCKVRKQAKRQLRLRQEFALMHGFSSTNVGKNRLTVSQETSFGSKLVKLYHSSNTVVEMLAFFRKVKLLGKRKSLKLQNKEDKNQVNFLCITMTSIFD